MVWAKSQLTEDLVSVDTRVAKTFSRTSYEKGVVLVKCPSCNNIHCMADRLGWFGKAGSVEDYLAEQGQGTGLCPPICSTA